MKLQAIKPMLYTKQVKETVDFYTSILGFTCENHLDDWSWAALSRDEIEIMAAYPNAHLPFEQPLFTGSFYMMTDDVDVIWNVIKDKVKVCYELETFDYGMREFAIYDNNGYLLQFGQPV
ncbi:MAG TPA: VOC family protein [Mucilaginibacter sp.]|jgi:uncharacterized glyoxalase superfamily protein PhnB|nr:VOC family protein [Mucilaginibacter sp.]